ncbi:DUF3606 domain-containing protein [Mesorhizobium sp.]|uniref:DUF3606 domain-containing protein n=3 Tax=Mesorhizobium TaxID=68287 RepID=UPI0032B024D1
MAAVPSTVGSSGKAGIAVETLGDEQRFPTAAMAVLHPVSEGPRNRLRSRDIFIPDLHTDNIKVDTRDFRGNAEFLARPRIASRTRTLQVQRLCRRSCGNKGGDNDIRQIQARRRDRWQVSGGERYEVNYFARKQGISRDQAEALIKRVGTTATSPMRPRRN